MKKMIRAMAIAMTLVGTMTTVTVYAQSNFVRNSQDTYVIGVDEKVTLEYGKIEPQDYTWESTDEDIVSSTKTGKAIGNSEGVAHIKCYNSEGDVIRKYKVKVQPAPKKIKLKVSKIAEFPKHKVDLAPSVNKGAICNKFTFKSSNKKVVVVDDKGIVKTVAKGRAVITVETYNGVKGKVSVRVKDPKKALAITFDDGPVNKNTAKVLDILKKNEYHATFFMIGNQVGGNSKVVKRMYKEGNELGTHTWEHDIHLYQKSKAAIKNDIEKSMKAIRKASGQNPTVLRTPGGNKGTTELAVCKELGLPVILWNVDTLDWKYRDATRVKNTLLKNASGGKVILVHDLHATTVEGFAKAVPELKKKGYELVTVSELAELRGKKLKPGEVYYGF